VVVAEEQTAGRGRLDRAWTSPARAGLTFSVLLRPVGVPPARWAWLPLLAGVALTRAVRRVAQVEARLKWPNDLLLDGSAGSGGGGKAAGVLAEVVGDAVVVGVGLNVTTTRAELPAPEATSLLLAGAATTDRDTLLRAVLRELAEDYGVWCAHAGAADGSGLRAAYVESCATLGRQVRVTRPGREPLAGEAVDVDADGRLVVDTAGGPVPIAAGDVIHLRPAT
jgi:BirA family biotin operon repressor/biotin-[acetyl-CoA-carboxylase] ligase